MGGRTVLVVETSLNAMSIFLFVAIGVSFIGMNRSDILTERFVIK